MKYCDIKYFSSEIIKYQNFNNLNVFLKLFYYNKIEKIFKKIKKMLTKKEKFYICNNKENYMARSSIEKIEADKDRVLQEIISNSRESFNNIAKNLGFSRQKVWKYLKEEPNLILPQNKVFQYSYMVR